MLIKFEGELTNSERRAIQAHRRATSHQTEEELAAQSDEDYLAQYFTAQFALMVRDYRRATLPGLLEEYGEQLLEASDETIEKIIAMLPPKLETVNTAG
jgi:hypothetical protein